MKQKRLNQIHRSLEDRTILFGAFLAYISPFQRYGGAKKIGARNTLLTDGTRKSAVSILILNCNLSALFNGCI